VQTESAPPDERPSKSQRKREMHARQELGEKLVELAPDALRRMDLPEPLREAIEEARRIRSHEARRRQLQYVGRLMRDSDYAAVEAAYERALGGSRAAVTLMHRCERLRDRLIDEDAALHSFLEANAGIDAQWLRAKVRAARQERAAARPPRHARELYRWLHARLLQEAGVSAEAGGDAGAGSEGGPKA
jgi:ribosome-associated protein